MEEKAYFCPNCRSNRTKFRVYTTTSQSFMKEPVTGEIHSMADPIPVEEQEPTIGCIVCGFAGNEMRFVKQAEREPRIEMPTNSVY